jgi:hypothetical protein
MIPAWFRAGVPLQVTPSGNFTTMVNEPDGVQDPDSPLSVYVTVLPEIVTVGITPHTILNGAIDTTANEVGTIS